ncbi:MAG: helix-turn-helix domain-containing protein [Candidatus Faecousia sp.]|nr:helix-turn-helix domain-containing protein [Candidatus Faecousia sp.]
MTFNYGAEKRKFEKVWAKLAKTYAEAGMEPEAIKAMYEFDWEIFKSERNEALHTQEFAIPESSDEEMDDCESPLYEKFLEQLSSEYDTYGSHSRYWWLEELTTPCLTIGVPALTVEDKELLTLYIVDGLTIREIARYLNLQKSTISERLQRIFTLFPSEE